MNNFTCHSLLVEAVRFALMSLFWVQQFAFQSSLFEKGAGYEHIDATAVISELTAAGIDAVSEIDGLTTHEDFSLEKLALKMAVNCAGAVADDNSCAAAALGSVGAEIYKAQFSAEELAGMNPSDLQEGAENVAIVLGAFASGGDINNLNTTVGATNLDVTNNYLNKDEVREFAQEVENCGDNSDCVAIVTLKYAELSASNSADMLRDCGDNVDCMRGYLDEIMAANGELYALLDTIDNEAVNPLEHLQYYDKQYAAIGGATMPVIGLPGFDGVWALDFPEFENANCSGMSNLECMNGFYQHSMSSGLLDSFTAGAQGFATSVLVGGSTAISVSALPILAEMSTSTSAACTASPACLKALAYVGAAGQSVDAYGCFVQKDGYSCQALQSFAEQSTGGVDADDVKHVFDETMDVLGVAKVADDVAATNTGAGSLSDGTFAQVKAKPTKPFSSEGQAKYSELAGEPIETVQDLTNAINTGKINPADIQVDYVMINGQPVIANTRTSTALTNAGVPQNQWNGVNQTGQIQYGTQTFDQAVQNQINNNAGQPILPSDW